ncbi:transketolase [Propionivibrio dicarboxylicus]|uniref:Transketolase n=1 Tax=Propionivibrio dicarboxylicus TaxID=83767 RepID=A0A1G7W0F9_9RHOO|nr:transketolase [Propionivibrio dicarboxylicus]SDG65512.1 transketolase [Propionivibrio dicarboxylicus]
MATPTSLANAIRILAMDGVQAANSGHPGAPMGMAEIAVALWNRHLKHNPTDPKWANRDRFVLSNGHGSMLIYSLLHLTGYDLPLDELKKFRQLHSKTPGHPEVGHTAGVETTTGPLGQGIGNAVGMALAEKLLAAEFNKDGHAIVDHYTYTFLGDGCLMEGISHEVCSLAGVWKLSKLIALYDDNGISIDGHVEGWFGDDTPKRFEAYGWNVIRNVDGHDVDAVDRAIAAAKAQSDKPTLICCKTVIGKGSPNKAGTHDVHGAPLGKDEVAATRAALGITAEPFEIAADVRAAWDARSAGAQLQSAWTAKFAAYRQAFPELAAEFERRMAGDLAADYATKATEALQAVAEKGEVIATRKSSQNAIQALAALMPEFVGGSADLAPSNLTMWKGCREIKPETIAQGGNYLHYGVREFGMAAIMNGLCLHGGFRPFGGTFLMFSEYARNAIRMASLMKINPIYVFTHDSVGVGEDGPTHQPIEQTATLRMIPNLDVWRPCDSVEAFVAWQIAVEHRQTPTALILTRQNLAHNARDAAQVAAIRKGGYVLKDCAGTPKAVIIATGSEVSLAVAAQQALADKGIPVRVVSMPSNFVFDQQDAAYRDSVLPRGIPRVAVEAGSTTGWYRYVGLEGAVVGIDRFGECGPAAQVFEYLGITAAKVEEAVTGVLRK